MSGVLLMPTHFVTGFPGFLATELLPRLLAAAPRNTTATCLIQTRYAELAHQRRAEIVAVHPDLEGRVRLVEGDIRLPDLGLEDVAEIQRETTAVFHLAAVYDLGVQRELAMAVNVRGTVHMLDFAARCAALERFHHISTCYVSGDSPGDFGEDDLEKGQGFLNYYEESKYLAEIAVRERMEDGLPAVVYRPSIVTGGSRTGATQKYDGIYYVIQWLLRQPRLAVLPSIGDPSQHYANLAPRDYVIEAIAELMSRDDSVGRTYHLCDPEPPTVEEVVEIIGAATERRILRVPLTPRLAKASIRRVPGVRALMRMPAEIVDYFAHPAHHTCAVTTAALEGSGIQCPRFGDYAGRLVAFMRRNPDVAAAGLS
jgi:nucleoside-diphosphate-sugar epimerase